MAKTTLLNVTVADAYLALLADRGVDYFFANAGTDFAPIVEAMAKAQNLETRIPTPVTCPHENTAMHMAIGYYLVTGKPQAVMVHVNVGTANGMNGLLNAARGNIPMLFTAGRTPTNEEGVAGHRSLDIHWTQEMFDQASMVREAAKWDYELRNGKQTETIVDRALSIAKSEPTGPVYLSLPREVLSEQMNEFTFESPGRQQAPAPPYPNVAATDEVAALLANSESPLIITNWAGRNPRVWTPLGELAERYAIPVVQYRNRYMSLPTNHPMNLGYDLQPLLGQADTILVIDVAVPWLPATDKVRDDAKVIHMGADPLHSYVPLRGHPCDIALACGTDVGLTALAEALSTHEGRIQGNIGKRRKALAEMWRKQRDGWTARLDKVKHDKPLHPVWVTHCINQLKDEDTIVVKESQLASSHIDITQPGTLLNAGAASGLGHGLGVALGAKLAAPDRLVIGTHGDGSYMFGNPIASHYVGAEQKLPILTVIFNNQRWQAVRRATVGLNPEGHAAQSEHQPITMLDSIDKYERAVEVADGYGQRVEDPADLMPALERGLKAVQVEQRQAVINVICSA